MGLKKNFNLKLTDPPNHFTSFLGSRILSTCLKKMKQLSITGNRSSQLDNNESCVAPGFGLAAQNDFGTALVQYVRTKRPRVSAWLYLQSAYTQGNYTMSLAICSLNHYLSWDFLQHME